MGVNKPNVSIICSSQTNQISANKLFTPRIIERLSSGENLVDSFTPYEGKNISGNNRPQVPVAYGPKIPNFIGQAGDKNIGVVILVSGQARDQDDAKIFKEEIDSLDKLYKQRGYTTLLAKTYEEYLDRVQEAKMLGKDNDKDALIVHLSGHASIYRKAIEVSDDPVGEKLQSLSLPPKAALDHHPDGEGVFHFQNTKGQVIGLEYSDLTHESAIMGKIYDASKDFKHVVVVADTCHAGVFNEQFLTNKKYPPLKISLDDIYNGILR